jgi:hypothetical protein
MTAMLPAKIALKILYDAVATSRVRALRRPQPKEIDVSRERFVLLSARLRRSPAFCRPFSLEADGVHERWCAVMARRGWVFRY